jgi:hypothetical protein
MHPVIGAGVNDVIFGPYFLVPFGLAIAVLILEIALTSEHRNVHWIAMLVPAALVSMAMIGHRGDPIYRAFLDTFTVRLGGDPVFCAMLAVVGFYGYAAVRRAEWAIEAMMAALTLLAIVGRHSLTQGVLAEPLPAPLMIAATVLLGLGVRRRESWRCFVGGFGLALGVALAFPAEAELTPYRLAVVFHLILTVTLILGAAFDDAFARILRAVGVALAVLAGLVALAIPSRLPAWLFDLYPLMIAVVLTAYAVWHRPALPCAALLFCAWTLATGWQIYRVCRQLVVGLDFLVVSLAVFALALGVSLAKAGVLARWYGTWRRRLPDPTD